MKQAKQKTTLMEILDISDTPKIKDSVTDLNTYTNRLIKMNINLQGKDSVTVIIAYAPTSSAEDEQAEKTMMILKEQWLILTQNIRSLYDKCMQPWN